MDALSLSNKKPWAGAEFLERLRVGGLPSLPVTLTLREDAKEVSTDLADGSLDVTWQGSSCAFVFEYKTQNTPKALESAIANAQRAAKALTPLRPLVIVPYLSEDSFRLLEAEGVSGIDLSGNALVLAPNFSVWRSGQPNRFKQESAIRNVYWGNSSLIARCFLLQGAYSSLSELRTFALARFRGRSDASTSILTKGTVSKVVQVLEEEKIVARSKEGVRLSDPQRLLERLKANYRKPLGACVEGKTPFKNDEMWTRLNQSSLRAVVSGDSSATHYRVLSGQDKLTVYVDNIEKAQQCLKITPTPLFPNIELREEKSDLYYFDSRTDGDMHWASPVQAWIELVLGGPREREAAEELDAILRKGEGASQL